MTTPATAPLRIVYFAWVRERIGHAEETVAPPPHVVTVADLVAWLAARDDASAHALARPEVIRTAIDQRHVRQDAVIAGAREIAFFPPVTGG